MRILHIDEDSCLNGSVGIIPTQIVGSASVIDTQIVGSVNVIDTFIRGSVGIICTPNTEVVFRFEYPNLFWQKDENVIGVTKFNMITASGNWILKEIEELL